ncbi:TPA: hypothetical protein N2D16_002769 [Clostridium botulinum]|nr:hypothetical protein [Clostridium botulinum]HCL4455147.1 hypothetical protein [Clostridium botulinum]
MDLQELGKKIIKECGSEDLESCDSFKIDGDIYALEQIEEGDWISEGKYEYSSNVFRIGIANKECAWKVDKPLNLYINQDVSRTGSYYTDYTYDYEEPYIVEQKEETVVVKKWVAI